MINEWLAQEWAAGNVFGLCWMAFLMIAAVTGGISELWARRHYYRDGYFVWPEGHSDA